MIQPIELPLKDSLSDELWVNEFTPESALRFRHEVRKLNKSNPNKPIIIYIDTGGGSVDSLAIMLETMDEVTNPFITVAYGKAYSCGAILLSQGHIRYCTKLSRIMVHNVASGVLGDVDAIKSTAIEVTRVNNLFMSLLARNCKTTLSQIRMRIRSSTSGKELWLSPEEALKFGIIDQIGKPAVHAETSWQCLTSVVIDKNAATPIVNKKDTKKKAQYEKA